ncbi:MAG: spore cortex biosynthesis protein YabQ [Lysinibacillus sp.]
MAINAYSLSVMFFSGIAAATIVDFIRLTALSLKSPYIRKTAALLEVLVWALLGCATFYLLLVVNYGDWRAVEALAQLLGIFVYNLYLRGIIHFIGSLAYKLFISPILWIGRLLIAIIHKLLKFIMKLLNVPYFIFAKIFKKTDSK